MRISAIRIARELMCVVSFSSSYQCDSQPSEHLCCPLSPGSGSPSSVDIKIHGQLRLERELKKVKEV